MDIVEDLVFDEENTKPKRVHSTDSEAEVDTPSKRPRLGTAPTLTLSSTKIKRTKKSLIKEERDEQKALKAKEKEEAKQLREEEKARKAREKEEAQAQKALKAKEKEEVQTQKAKEKEEIQRLREEEKALKAKEKEDAQRLRDEKKRQKEEEQKLKTQAEEDEKLKMKRQSDALLKFFVKKKTEEPKKFGWYNNVFMPFEIKDKMTVAPVHRRKPLSKSELDSMMTTTLDKSDYLAVVSKIKRKRIVKDPMRAKYFHFNDNFRPPYYGTWRKRSEVITGRRPFALSHNELSYDIDSDAEWEEEQAEAGEECLSDPEEAGDDDSRDTSNDFCVNHGYLSASEGSEDDSNLDENPEQRKLRMEQRAREFNKQVTNKTRRVTKNDLIPQIYGLNWKLPSELTPDLAKRLMKAVVFNFS